MKLLKPKFERVNEEFDFELPKEPVYYFSGRKAYRITPVYTTWNCNKEVPTPEEIFQLDCTVVHQQFETSIHRFSISVGQSALQRYIDYQSGKKSYNQEEEVIYHLIDYPLEDKRTKERFEQDFETAIKKLTE